MQGPGRLGDETPREAPAAGALVGADGDLVPVPVVALQADVASARVADAAGFPDRGWGVLGIFQVAP